MAYKIYDVTASDMEYLGYEVRVNGQAVTLDVARVSAIPFNRRWPGHQRQIEQTELVNFLSMATDEPLEFEITPCQPFEKVEIRPRSLNIQPVVRDGKICFTLEKPAYFTVEPYGRSNALHIFADPMPNYEIDPNGENVIYFGKGQHDVGVIELKSNQTLFLDEGAVVYASVLAQDAQNIQILGRGILDHGRCKEEILFEANVDNNTKAIKNANRRNAMTFRYCENVKIEGITIRDSLLYNIRPTACTNVDISNVKIIGNWRYNSDGIDMHNCENVRIDNCFLRTFDDCICVKGFDFFTADNVEEAVRKAMYHGGKVYDTFHNVRVSNCVLWNDWGRCLEIGAETKAEQIYDIVFEDCDAIHVIHSVLDCQNFDYALVHDVTYRNIRIELDDVIPQPILQTSDNHQYCPQNPDYAPPIACAVVKFHHEYSVGIARRGSNRDIVFEDIHLYGRQTPIFRFGGYDETATTENITVRNVYQNGKKLTAEDPYKLMEEPFCKNIKLEF